MCSGVTQAVPSGVFESLRARDCAEKCTAQGSHSQRNLFRRIEAVVYSRSDLLREVG